MGNQYCDRTLNYWIENDSIFTTRITSSFEILQCVWLPFELGFGYTYPQDTLCCFVFPDLISRFLLCTSARYGFKLVCYNWIFNWKLSIFLSVQQNFKVSKSDNELIFARNQNISTSPVGEIPMKNKMQSWMPTMNQITYRHSSTSTTNI